MAQLREPGPEDPVDLFGAHDLIAGPGKLARVQHERVALRPTHPSMGADELLERRHLAELRPVGAVDHHVRAMRKSVGAKEVARGIGAERAQWVLAFHSPLVEICRPSSTDSEWAMALGAHEKEADPRVIPKRWDQPWI